MKILAYAVSAIIGFLIGHYLFEGAPAAYATLLISYHLFLAYLVVTAAHEKGLSMPIGVTIVYHLAFLGLLLGIAYGRAYIPFFFVVRWLIPALAPFETHWLFAGKEKPRAAKEEAALPAAEATIEDHEAFREYLTGKDRLFRKPGISVNQEFNLWLADRRKKAAEAEALAAAAAAAAAAQAADSAGSGAAHRESP